DGVLDIALMRGQRLVVNFEGNTVFSSGRLKKEVPFFEINDYSNDLLEETAGRLLTLYHDKGYAFAQVTPITVLRDDGIDITFFLFEGEEYSVTSVAFTGASINQERLRATLANRPGQRYNPDIMERDRETLEEFYRALGYLRVEVPEPEIAMDNADVSIHYTVREGSQVTVREISFLGNRSVSDDEIRTAIAIREGSPYNDVDIAETRARIDDLYDKKGYLDVRVDVERDMRDDGASVRFRIAEGTPVRFGKTIVVGNDRTKLKVITREFQHREGEPYDFGLLLKDRHSLQKLGLFSDIDVVPQEGDGDRKDVIYRLREAPAGSVDFGIGYSEYERLRGFFDVSYKNFGGMNRQGLFRAEMSSLLQRMTLSYVEPWFMERKIPFKALLLYEKKKEVNVDSRDVLYRLERVLASAGVTKKIREKYDAELYYDFSVVKTYDVQPDVILSRNDVGTQVISGFRPGLLYDNRDNPFTPQKGIFAGLSCKIASKLFLSETEFVKFSAFGNTYVKLSDRFVLALSLRGGLATGFGGTTELPIVERFFLGGRTTVRGYDQDELGPKGSDGNPTGGNAFLMENLELRADVGRGFGIVTFLDGGNVWQKVEDMKIGDFKFTVGIGLRYNTPVGPLRVDYGHKLDRESGESSGEIHFSLGHAF
ncbi:MAG TPA: outer membrane protein assembly factor BamA, partial [Dissulfurispiraceae bacterium]|nr:outer membrane protein assembly factor BamA [Dissulfurispiraceae bacterium]